LEEQRAKHRPQVLAELAKQFETHRLLRGLLNACRTCLV